LLNIVKADEEEQAISIDNYGSELTGDYVGTLNFEKSNYFNAGEKFDVDVIVSDNTTHSVQGTFSIPTGFSNVMFDTRYIQSNIEVGDRLDALGIQGETDIFDFAFSSKLINMRKQVLQLRTGLQMRQHESFLQDTLTTKDNIRQMFVEGSYLARLPNILIFTSMRVAAGLDIWGAAEKGESDATRAEGDPEVVLLQPTIFANIRTSDKGTLQATMTGQVASNVTLSSDLFVIGGYGSVRGFEPAETTGEAGWQASIEYSHEIWSGNMSGKAVTASAGPFFDGGHVWNRLDAQTSDNTLLSAGVGAEVQAALTKFGPTTLRLDVAFSLGDYESEQVETATVYLRLGQTF
jgi:hemolysin activation/secretion protein